MSILFISKQRKLIKLRVKASQNTPWTVNRLHIDNSWTKVKIVTRKTNEPIRFVQIKNDSSNTPIWLSPLLNYHKKLIY